MKYSSKRKCPFCNKKMREPSITRTYFLCLQCSYLKSSISDYEEVTIDNFEIQRNSFPNKTSICFFTTNTSGITATEIILNYLLDFKPYDKEELLNRIKVLVAFE